VDIWTWLERAGALVALFGLPYLIYDRRRRLPHIRFDFYGSNGTAFQRGNLQFGRIEFQGAIRNRSLEPNSLHRLWLVVWRNRRHSSSLRFGFGGNEIYDLQGVALGPPLALGARQSLRVRIVCEFPLTGTQDAQLFTEMRALPIPSGGFLPAHEYELVFEDVSSNMFDQRGFPVSRRLIELKWTLPNVSIHWRAGSHQIAARLLLRHVLGRATEEVRFAAKRVLAVLGL
jgi:hypothetical protein